jgi:TPR repeat protein
MDFQQTGTRARATEAVRFIEQAAEQEHPMRVAAYALMMELGFKPTNDTGMAARLYKTSVELGNVMGGSDGREEL